MSMFSVIMSVYNREAYVEKAVRSVLDQTFTDWEMIIIDDGSRDSSLEILDRLARADSRIVIVHQENAGVSAARKRAALIARGQWLTYLDSDDLWFNDALGHYAAYISAHARAQFIYGYYHRLRGNKVIPLQGEFQDRPTGTVELFQRIFLAPQCVCHRPELLQKAGNYDAGLRYCDDYDLYLRMSLHCQFEPIAKPIGLRRRHDSNLSQKTGKSQKVEAEILRRFVDQNRGSTLLSPGIIARRLSTIYYRAARQFFKERSYRQAREMAREAQSYRLSFKAGWTSLLSLLMQPLEKSA